MRKVNLKPVLEFAKDICGIVACGAGILALSKLNEKMLETPSSVTVARYSDAVNAIMESDMFSSDKRRAVSVLKRDGDTEFYKAIIAVAKDDSMFSCDQVHMIEHLSNS